MMYNLARVRKITCRVTGRRCAKTNRTLVRVGDTTAHSRKNTTQRELSSAYRIRMEKNFSKRWLTTRGLESGKIGILLKPLRRIFMVLTFLAVKSRPVVS